MIRRPPRSTLDRSSAASDVYKRQDKEAAVNAYLDAKDYQDRVQRAGVTLEIPDSYATDFKQVKGCLLYTSPSPRDRTRSRMPSSA